ncbi:hypothetical protein LXL04_015866 [Taraxacum kok-saghyz]
MTLLHLSPEDNSKPPPFPYSVGARWKRKTERRETRGSSSSATTSSRFSFFLHAPGPNMTKRDSNRGFRQKQLAGDVVQWNSCRRKKRVRRSCW